ncbi:hypothetical protein [Kribbia dieselivorans]|uniref:hypothetical protein n=1 Tax=Kribbia dieselivorans TaxID=331526 RepID=UPI00083984CD|nr:hypothetical protein [Kribbia dieselivorans]
MAYDLNTTTLGELLEDERVAAVFEKHAPGVTSNPMLGMAKGMSVNQAIGMAGAIIPQDKIDAIKAEIEAF